MAWVVHTRRACLKTGSAALLGAWVTGGLLSACGGGSGSDEPKQDAGNALRSASPASSDAGAALQAKTPAKRRARAYALKGITAITASRDRSRLAVANAQGQVWTLNGVGKELSRMNTVEPTTAVGKSAALSANPSVNDGAAATAGLVLSGNDKYLLAVNRNSTATAWRVDNSQKQFVLQGHEHGLRSVAASDDGALIATGGEETRVMLWDGSTGKLKQILRGATDFVNSVSVSPNGQFVAGGDANGLVLVWQAATGKLLHSLRGHVGEVNAVAFEGSGQRLVSASEDGKVLLWDVATGKGISALLGQRAEVRSIAFDSANALLASGAVDGTVVVWDLASGRVVLINKPMAPSPQSTPDTVFGPVAVNALAFSSSAEGLLFAGLDDGNVVPIKLSSGGIKQ
jgi:WD40 repeat protein